MMSIVDALMHENDDPSSRRSPGAAEEDCQRIAADLDRGHRGCPAPELGAHRSQGRPQPGSTSYIQWRWTSAWRRPRRLGIASRSHGVSRAADGCQRSGVRASRGRSRPRPLFGVGSGSHELGIQLRRVRLGSEWFPAGRDPSSHFPEEQSAGGCAPVRPRLSQSPARRDSDTRGSTLGNLRAALSRLRCPWQPDRRCLPRRPRDRMWKYMDYDRPRLRTIPRIELEASAAARMRMPNSVWTELVVCGHPRNRLAIAEGNRRLGAYEIRSEGRRDDGVDVG